ncbi:MAG: hypothetical protein LBJ79_00170 [Endomicrobium sp.]|jgi:surfactin synthase thioesterase subunit|nr:hypothetical protein [Endomicrobium sp.]
MGKTTLLCLPYTGGSSNMYTPLKKHISGDVKVLAVELKGRGTKISEDLSENFDEMIEDTVNEVLKENIQDY